MPTLDRPGGPLHYDVTDVTAPWAGEPETILFHHGVGITGDIWLEWLGAPRARPCPVPASAGRWSFSPTTRGRSRVRRAPSGSTTSANRWAARSACGWPS